MSEKMLELAGVSVRYRVGDIKNIGLKEVLMQHLTGTRKVTDFWADRGISLTLEAGDFLGIIGTNGAGKSTLLKAISGVMEPSEGRIVRNGKVTALLELASGFDGNMTVRENAYLRGAMLGYTRDFMDCVYDDIIAFAGLEDFQNYSFRQLSSGMKSRLAFSIASLVKPEILILDEVLSVGDGAFRVKSEAKLKEIIGGGATTILVSHSLGQIRSLCNKILWLDHGRQIAFTDDVKGVCDCYERFLKAGGTNPVYSRSAVPPAPAMKPASAVAAPKPVADPSIVRSVASGTLQVSVVVVTHNGARFLHGCLESVLSQKGLAGMECICVDDGSVDETSEVLRRWRKRDGRLRVVSRKVEGPGAARNAGLAEAKGEYVAFLNADDRLASDQALARVYATAVARNLDVLLCDGGAVSADGRLTPHVYLTAAKAPKAEVFTPVAAGDSLFALATGAPLAKLFRRAHLLEQRLAFPPLMRAEDAPFVQLALATAARIGISFEPLANHHCLVGVSLWEKTRDDYPEVFLAGEDFFYAELARRDLLSAFDRAARLASVKRLAYNLMRVERFTSFAGVVAAAAEHADGWYRQEEWISAALSGTQLAVVGKALGARTAETLAQAFAEIRMTAAGGQWANECNRLRRQLKELESRRKF